MVFQLARKMNCHPSELEKVRQGNPDQFAQWCEENDVKIRVSLGSVYAPEWNVIACETVRAYVHDMVGVATGVISCNTDSVWANAFDTAGLARLEAKYGIGVECKDTANGGTDCVMIRSRLGKLGTKHMSRHSIHTPEAADDQIERFKAGDLAPFKYPTRRPTKLLAALAGHGTYGKWEKHILTASPFWDNARRLIGTDTAPLGEAL
jgi:hypothetical protein